jgi:hypothetical protein
MLPVQERLTAAIRNLGFDVWRYPSHHDMYKLLAHYGLMHCKSRIIDRGGFIWINGVYVDVISKLRAQQEAKENKRTFIHRIYVVCDCGKRVPFGRLHQHKCK